MKGKFKLLSGIVIALGIVFCLAMYKKMVYKEQSIEQATALKQSRRKFVHNKLWRDKAVEQLEQAHGDIIHRKALTDEEYAHQLGLKLLEEAGEVITATSHQDMTSEVGDVLEVLDCIIALHGLSHDAIEQARNKKRDERGSYLERKFVLTTESVPGSFLDVYCSKDPDKYQLIVE